MRPFSMLEWVDESHFYVNKKMYSPNVDVTISRHSDDVWSVFG